MSTAVRTQCPSSHPGEAKVHPAFNAEKLIAEFRGQVGVRVPSAENKKKKHEVQEETTD